MSYEKVLICMNCGSKDKKNKGIANMRHKKWCMFYPKKK